MVSKRIISLTIFTSILILIGGLPIVLPSSRTILGTSAVGPSSAEYGLIQMGYSAAQLTALNASIPTFTSGDFMWVQTRFNSTASIILINPNGTAVSNKSVQPDSPAMIFSFNSTNGVDGVWSLNVSASSVGNLLVPITFVSPTDHEMQAGLVSYRFKGDRLAAGFSLSSQSAYGTEGCLLSNFPASVITLSTQPEFGGAISIENFLNGSVLMTEGGSPSQPFELFLEMFYLYSYQTPGSSSFASTFQEAAFTNPVVISTPGQISYTPLDSLVGMRNGTYELRVFFEVGGNLSVEQTEILFQGVSQPWVWLGGCQMSVPLGPVFVATSNLYNSTNSGPLTLFLSYYVDGVNLFYLQPVSLELSELQFFVNSLQNSPNSIGIEASTRQGNLTIV
ncbi:MAG TPA: hypothetical protein VJN71_08350, partial [Nitrososphaerales archaeon]|nr:hypothetical protein [Nitrososphaerales archaeon]